MKKKLGMLVYENAQPIDFIGPWEVFSIWKNSLNAPIEMYLVSEQGSYVTCANDIIVKTHFDFKNTPELDYLVVPGGVGRLQEVNNEKLISFIVKQAKTSQYILSICTGMFLLHKAGLLDNQFATTYWRAMPEAKLLPNITIVEERMVKNDKIWLSGGLSSGIDLAIEFIAELAGNETAGKVQLLFEYFPKKPSYSNQESRHFLPPYYGHENEEPANFPKYISDSFKKDR